MAYMGEPQKQTVEPLEGITVEISEAQAMTDYWEIQRQHAENALRYAREQKAYWVGKLALLQEADDMQRFRRRNTPNL